MNEIAWITLALITGIVLGTFFFGGLWITVKKAIVSKAPVLWFMGSLILRVGVTLIGFYGIASGSWQRLLACGAGFTIARLIVLHVTRSLDEKQNQQKNEVSHEA